MRQRPKRQLLVGAGLAIAGSIVLIWELIQTPLIYVLLIGIITGGITARLTLGPIRTLAFNAALFSALLLPVEAYLAYRDRTAAPQAQPPALTLDAPLPEGITTALPSDPKWVLTENRGGLTVYQSGGHLVKLHPRWGWIHRESARIGERMYRGEELLYDVIYNIGPDGLRVTTSPQTPEPNAPVVLFLGCSFTFGQGLPDDQTLPSAFQAAAAGKYRAANWGISGAGPHSILAQFEEERDRTFLAGARSPYAVYVAIRHHLRRIQGDTHFSPFYPKYRLRDGLPVADGQFESPKARSQFGFGEAVSYEARKSHLVGHLIERLPSAIGWVDDDAVELFVALVTQIQKLYAERYGGQLLVVLWDDFGPEQEPIEDGLGRAGIRFFNAGMAFPDFSPATHFLPYYRHPNADANAELAGFLVGRITP